MGTVYKEVKDIIDSLEIGETETISVPSKIGAFRKYLSEISKRENKAFKTKVMDGKMHIMRVKYSNIYSKTVE